ncbi:hypothetical protein [Tahibacter sp.]|uniref:hypothetical protein n=1 Tax=Tahibacter sp. TaxID=2056211 RepID=UPI0028C3AEC9|nr:hypothetical protein [Tahibacter sp.]
MKLRTLVLLGLAWPGSGLAGRAVHESLDSVLARTDRAVVVRVLSVRKAADRFAREIEIEATPQEMLIGQLPNDATLYCRYAEGVVHRRGDATVSPLVSGSGEEFDLRRGDQVILLLSPTMPAESPAGPREAVTVDPTTGNGEDASANTDVAEGTEDETQPCDILRIEPVQNRRLIARRRQP